MKKLVLILSLLLFAQQSFAFDWNFWNSDDEKTIRKFLKSQVSYANKSDFNKFISTYAPNYINSDGFNLDVYSSLVKDIWNTYDDIKYGIDIKNITIDNDCAKVELLETAYANIKVSKAYNGELKSESNTIYNLKKIDGKWKVVSDEVLDETTSMLYGDARDLEIKLTVPNNVNADTEYTASLEFLPPCGTIAIASIASDKVEYPQKPTKEVFRPMPEDHILERLFTSNSDNLNEYIVASIGLTRTAIDEENIKLNLTGFGYAIKRVNVIPAPKKEVLGEIDVKN